jgi:RNA polymerase sigma factor (sigma-70 family)
VRLTGRGGKDDEGGKYFVERSDKNAGREDDELASMRYPTSARLLAAIHSGDETAIRELFLLYTPLLRDQARRLGVDIGHRDEVVTTLLDDVVLHLMEYQLSPRHLSRYLVASLRNRARNRHRDSFRRAATQERAYRDLDRFGQRAVAESHSAYGLRASMTLDAEDACTVREPIAALAAKSAQLLSRDEMVMLVCVGRQVPLREIGAQLGISYAAARVRLHRLRERLRMLAIEHVASLKADDRRELERFFRRAEVSLSRGGVAKREEKANGQI